jgi:Negative regulator of sigma E activity
VILRNFITGVVTALLLLAATPALSVQTEYSADQLVSLMAVAMRSTNYRGTLTYEHGGTLETLQVTHWVDEGREFEHYLHLSGPEQQLSRSGGSLGCKTLGSHLLRGGALQSPDGAILHLSEHYQFYTRGYARIAGRKAIVIQLLPKDDARLGITLAVDTESALLVKAVVSSSSRVLERLQFVSLDIDPQLDEDERKSLVIAAGKVAPTCGSPEPESRIPWAASWIPSGFVRASAQWTDADGFVETYTDGVNSFSVFIKPAGAGEELKPNRIAHRGATLIALTTQQIAGELLHITLVGELPQNTAQQVLVSVRPLATTTTPAANESEIDVESENVN